MRISNINVQNFLGLPDFRHALASPLLVIAGPNGAGKSSLQDAIKFVLVEEMARGITKVGDRPKLITEGAAAGFVQLVVDGYEVRRNIGSGKLSGDLPAFPKSLPMCLDATRFATLPEAERRRWLFELANVQVNREAVAKQLADHSITAATIDVVMPLLRDGFPAAAAYAKDQAAQARGAWKNITKETYGSVKAPAWKADVPEIAPTEEEIEEVRGFVEAGEAKVQALLEAKGRAAAAVSPAKLADLTKTAAGAADWEEAVAAAESMYDAAVAQVNKLSAQVVTPEALQGTRLDCPCCDAALMLDGGVLREHVELPVPDNSRVQAQLNGAKQSVTLASRALDEAREALREADAAQLALDNLPAATPGDETAAARLETERANLGVHRATLTSLEDAMRRVDAAHGQTDRALAQHAKVEEWVKVEAQLGPDGIPATLLARALDPINDALARQAEIAGFRPARVERDLSLSYGDRHYNLVSESERWRADALFAVVVAVLSGCRIATIDRFDVLDPESRPDTIDWLQALVEGDDNSDPMLDTVILSGTLKSKPDLGEGVDVVWLPGKVAA